MKKWPFEIGGIVEVIVTTFNRSTCWNVALLGLHGGETVTARTWGKVFEIGANRENTVIRPEEPFLMRQVHHPLFQRLPLRFSKGYPYQPNG